MRTLGTNTDFQFFYFSRPPAGDMPMAQTVRRPAHMGGSNSAHLVPVSGLPDGACVNSRQAGSPSPVPSGERTPPPPTAPKASEWARGGIPEYSRTDRRRGKSPTTATGRPTSALSRAHPKPIAPALAPRATTRELDWGFLLQWPGGPPDPRAGLEPYGRPARKTYPTRQTIKESAPTSIKRKKLLHEDQTRPNPT